MAWLRDGIAVCSRVLRRVPPAQQFEWEESKVAILRRGLSPEYYFYFEIFAKQNDLEVVVDRRIADRRCEPGHVAEDRRTTDRRGPLPTTWNQADIVIPHAHDSQEEAPLKPWMMAVPPPQR